MIADVDSNHDGKVSFDGSARLCAVCVRVVVHVRVRVQCACACACAVHVCPCAADVRGKHARGEDRTSDVTCSMAFKAPMCAGYMWGCMQVHVCVDWCACACARVILAEWRAQSSRR